VVNDWTSAVYTPGNFFISTVNVLGVSQVAAPSGSWTGVITCVGTPSAACNNLTAFVWTEAAQANGASFSVAAPGLYASPQAVAFTQPDYGAELARCQRYFLYLGGVPLGFTMNGNSLYSYGQTIFPVTMLKTPALISGTFTASAGAAGAAALSAASQYGTGFYNTSNNWTTNALVTLATAYLDGEL
jgi:hypothetical protein